MKKRRNIVVEGLWGVGKTSLCEFFEKEHGYLFLREPDHEKVGVPSSENLDLWYCEKHLENISFASLQEHPFIIERCVASTFAFFESVYNKKIDEVYGAEITNDQRIEGYRNTDFCVYLDVSRGDYERITEKRVSERMSTFLTPDFIKTYPDLLEKYLCDIFGTRFKKVQIYDEFGKRRSLCDITNEVISHTL